MTPRLLVVFLFVLLAIVAWLLLDLTEQALDQDGAATVKTVQQWGRPAPPYVIDGAAMSTTTSVPVARARTAPIKRTTMRAASAAPAVVEGSVNGYPCGGDLPPCYVLARESGGNPTAQNPHSTASGLWQVLDSTWRGYAGYAKARLAPADVQNNFARQLWNHGAGCHHWFACR